jgi:UDP-glucose 4-epimerase
MSVIVTGGAGYIGSHVVELLNRRGEEVIVIDDLSAGSASRIPDNEIHRIDLSRQDSQQEIRQLATEHKAHAVIHFAAKKSAPESIERPRYYFEQNVGGLLNLLAGIENTTVSQFVFSSSAAVYGDVDGQVTELSDTQPLNPYGDTKLMGEHVLGRMAATDSFHVVNLRYFNVAGAGNPHQADNSVSNLIPMVFERVRQGLPPYIFGDDYPTPDGTCVRDFIHVDDLAQAHIDALDFLSQSPQPLSHFNVGTGTGYSVKEVIDVVRSVTGFTQQPQILARREGDPARIVADPTKAQRELGWVARHSLEEMIESAWHAQK